ncbi:hypothetical protein MPSEU_001026100 [Mayamaea pseudoterrestris]|nr:hypothetical protein MPSEU_001026100 [Mayamaea pseudoterrestris]
MSSSASSSQVSLDIEDVHRQAVLEGSNIYHDPKTGFTVFTELAHLKRGNCCGNQCRHCPYGWENVTDKSALQHVPLAKVKSGDKAAIQQLLKSMNVNGSRQAVTAASLRKLSTSATTVDGNVLSASSSPASSSPISTVSTATAPTTTKTKTGGRHGGRLTDKNVPYTRTGDSGSSQLLTGERRSKHDVAFEAMGTVDELCAAVGLAHSQLYHGDIQEEEETVEDNLTIPMNTWLLDIMSRLFDIGSHVAKPRKHRREDHDDDNEPVEFIPDGVGGGFDAEHIQQLEDWIDILTEALPELHSFILPTGAPASAQLHVARTVCRRAERIVVSLVADQVCDPHALQYLNRLSDFLFAAARWANLRLGQEEVTYRRPTKGAKQRTRVTVSLQHHENDSLHNEHN